MDERLSTAEAALDDGSRLYGEMIDIDAVTTALERAGWSGPADAVEGAVEASSGLFGHSRSVEVFVDVLEGVGWSFRG